MKFLALLVLFLTAVDAHTIGQRLSVDGVQFPTLHGVRAPRSNVPLWSSELCSYAPEFCYENDLQKPTFACNDLDPYETSTLDVVDVPAGARVGMYWWYCIKDRNPEDCEWGDEAISGTHHGPLIYHLAKVDDAATTNTTGLNWFKIGQDGLDLSTDPGQWGTVPHLKNNNGWGYVDMPSCLASGNYLLRAEAISLHSAEANSYSGTQHFISCANINVVNGGLWTGSGHVQFPGAYDKLDPGLWVTGNGNISPSSVGWDNGRQPYTPPGGPVQTCPATEGTSTTQSAKFGTGKGQ